MQLILFHMQHSTNFWRPIAKSAIWRYVALTNCTAKLFLKLAFPFCVWFHQGMFKNYVEFKWKRKNICECHWIRIRFDPAKTTRIQRKENRQKIVLSFFQRICATAQKLKIEPNFVVFLIQISHFSNLWVSFSVPNKRRKQNKC